MNLKEIDDLDLESMEAMLKVSNKIILIYS